MNIFLREMKANRKTMLFWCVGLTLMILGGMGKYQGFQASGQSMQDLISAMPKSFRTIMGMDSFDLSTAIGFYGLLFKYLIIMATVYSSLLGATIISKEERDKTSEFLFVKPASRWKIITAKLSAAFVNLLVFNLLTYIVSVIMVGYYSKDFDDSFSILMLVLVMLVLQLIFMFLGSAMSAILNNPRSPASVTSGILLMTFLLHNLIRFNESLEVLNVFTPFSYFDTKDIIVGKCLDVSSIIISCCIIIVTIITTYVCYKDKDLKV